MQPHSPDSQARSTQIRLSEAGKEDSTLFKVVSAVDIICMFTLFVSYMMNVQ